MTFPAPRPGLVIRYSFLWSEERDAGTEEGAKDYYGMLPKPLFEALKSGILERQRAWRGRTQDRD